MNSALIVPVYILFPNWGTELYYLKCLKSPFELCDFCDVFINFSKQTIYF